MSEKKVIDNVVKMEWDASKAVYTKGGRTGRTFIYAAKDYETKVGTVTLFFNCDTVFIWASDAGTDEEDRWNAQELKAWIKTNLNGLFPTNYAEYVPVVEYGATTVQQDVIEKYGLEEYVDDILARLADVKPYSIEETMSLG